MNMLNKYWFQVIIVMRARYLVVVVIFVFKVAVIEPMNLKSIQHFSNQNKTIDYVMMMFQVMT